jgi:uncharacterized protein YyaL (SSP411 family)
MSAGRTGSGMKVSEFLREYQLIGVVPTAEHAMVAFWSGWLIGNAIKSRTVCGGNEAIEMAIKAAEFIEAQ